MPLRLIIIYFITLLGLLSCGNDNVSTSTNMGNVDSDFHKFIDYFSRDSNFQNNRTLFPLKVKQYQVVDDKDTTIYLEKASFQKIDFRASQTGADIDEWTQNTIIDKNKSRAIIEIRGIENGIMVDYNFEKRDGKWMLISIDDGST